MTKHRRLRPWVWATIEITAGAAVCVMMMIAWCYAVEAFCGFNPLWLLGAL